MYTLGRMCRKNSLVPDSILLKNNPQITKHDEARGHYADIHIGRWNAKEVAIKRTKLYGDVTDEQRVKLLGVSLISYSAAWVY